MIKIIDWKDAKANPPEEGGAYLVVYKDLNTGINEAIPAMYDPKRMIWSALVNRGGEYYFVRSVLVFLWAELSELDKIIPKKYIKEVNNDNVKSTSSPSN